jgi:hypothetical protein
MHARWLVGLVTAGTVALGSHGQPPAGAPVPPAAGQADGAKRLPDELGSLNAASRKLYAAARGRELAAVPVVIIVSGDDLVLRRGGKRVTAPVIPAEYHALKSVAHTALALFAHLADETDRPLGAERLTSLKGYQALAAAAGPAVEKFGFDPEMLARQKRLLARADALAGKTLRDGRVSADDLTKFCRASRADVLANGAAAARAQLRATHEQVMKWKAGMTAEEWASLTVVVPGVQTARVENAAVQYFSRLLGEPNGEGRRVVFAESLWDEDKALGLLGTLRLDGKLSEAVFGDRYRMHRDFLADGARVAVDEILAPE